MKLIIIAIAIALSGCTKGQIEEIKSMTVKEEIYRITVYGYYSGNLSTRKVYDLTPNEMINVSTRFNQLSINVDGQYYVTTLPYEIEKTWRYK